MTQLTLKENKIKTIPLSFCKLTHLSSKIELKTALHNSSLHHDIGRSHIDKFIGELDLRNALINTGIVKFKGAKTCKQQNQDLTLKFVATKDA